MQIEPRRLLAIVIEVVAAPPHTPAQHGQPPTERSAPGGLFAAMGVTCLLLQSDLIFWAIGIAWLGAALGRIWSLVIDRNFDRMKLRGIVMESAIAVPLMAPTLWIQ